MAQFGRRRDTSAAAGSSGSTMPGRRLPTSLKLARCEQMFRTLAVEQGGYTEFVSAGWSGGHPPVFLIAAYQNGRPALYLAAWDRGSSRELNLIPASDPAQLPQAMIGSWKMQDSSLSSTGTVTDFPVG
jgi:hypothetical protein